MFDFDDDTNEKIIKSLIDLCLSQTDPIDNLGPVTLGTPEQVLSKIKRQIQDRGKYESTGEFGGMGSEFTMVIKNVSSTGPEYNGEAYEVKVSSGINGISMVARFVNLEDSFGPMKAFVSLIDYLTSAMYFVERDSNGTINPWPVQFYTN